MDYIFEPESMRNSSVTDDGRYVIDDESAVSARKIQM